MTETTPETSSTARLPGVVAAYARRFHAAVGDQHHVASPLGAWLVLAMAAPAINGADAQQVTEALGMPAS
ncbi:serpin family protein, partial [Pseudonocardia sp. TRM90224]|uniref:serpin family protein n=1 Tax=Pseudonocardia sp. TRM90224 TaxID=2812678 RepID=UPI001E2ECB9D